MDQTQVGWDCLLDGWLVQQWCSVQATYWSQIHSQKSCKRWTSELIKKLWNTAWDLWEDWNEALHNSEKNCNNILERDINDQIMEVYCIGGHALPLDALSMMQQPLEHQLALPLATKKQWQQSMQIVAQRKWEHNFGAYAVEQHFMCMWVIVYSQQDQS